MFTNILFSFINISHDQEIDKLSMLIVILSIALITILALLTINLVKAHKLKAEIKRLKKQ